MVVVAGGIGLAPLRPAILRLFARRERYGRIAVLYGGRTPDTVLYPDQLRGWGADVTVDAAGREWRGRVGVVTKLIDAAAFDPGSAVAMTCGPEVMMRFAVEALLARGSAPTAPTCRWSATCSAASAIAGIASSGRRSSAATAPSTAGRRWSRGWRSGSCDQAQAGGVEVRLVRRLPAHRARLRGRAAGAGRRDRDRLLPRGVARDGRRAVRRLARRGLDHDGRRRRADPGGPARLASARHDRRVRDRGRHPGAAQLRRRRRVRVDRLRAARVHLDARDVDADRRPRDRSTSSCAAARSTSTSCSR